MVRQRSALFPDALPSLDRRMAQRSPAGNDSPAASALDFWSEYTAFHRNGGRGAIQQFRVLAFAFRRRMGGARPDRQMHVRGGLPALEIAARRRRPARLAGDTATRAAEKSGDNRINRSRAKREDGCCGCGGSDSAERLSGNERTRSASAANPKQHGNFRGFCAAGERPKITPSAG